ncbi:MAG TPA: peptidylprolyl isomerase [Pyrinomonadaceae bacterium]|nr:peptidylprolyl isomerase [Pyrinomonadaceae bacterium]
MKRDVARSAGASRNSRALWLVFILSFALALVGAGCNRGNSNNSNSKDFDQALTKDPPNLKKGIKPEPDAEVAVIEMQNPGYGRIVIELYPNIAPQMVARFKQLINEGFYNGTTFHRIDTELGIIQGGDPFSKDNIPGNEGAGDSPYPNVPGEFSDIPYERGTLGAARKGGGGGMTEEQAYNTANCQFFITLKRQPAFDKRYTVFGKVIEGLNNAEVIMGAPVEAGTERPSDPIIIKSITLQKRQ